jgi:hypothetical protein
MMNKTGLPGQSHVSWLMMNNDGLPVGCHRFADWLMMSNDGLPGDSHRFAGWLMMSTIMAYLGIAIGLLAG